MIMDREIVCLCSTIATLSKKTVCVPAGVHVHANLHQRATHAQLLFVCLLTPPSMAAISPSAEEKDSERLEW